MFITDATAHEKSKSQIMLKIVVLRSVNYKRSNTITKNTRTVSMWYNTCDLRSDISKIYHTIIL